MIISSDRRVEGIIAVADTLKKVPESHRDA